MKIKIYRRGFSEVLSCPDSDCYRHVYTDENNVNPHTTRESNVFLNPGLMNCINLGD